MTLEPNPPIKRMRHVIKTYRDSKAPWIPIQVARSAYYLMGLDNDVPDFNDFVEPFEEYLRGTFIREWRLHRASADRGLKTFVTSKEWAASHEATDPLTLAESKWAAEKEYDQMPQQERIDRAWDIFDTYLDHDLPKYHEHDFVLPWMARELGRLAKAARKEHASWTDYNDAEVALLGKGPAIAMWAAHENVDLNKTSLAEALEAIQHFDAFEGEMPQGRVVYRFDDGWTVQELNSDDQLEAEGQAMQHCVGDYCLGDMPETFIYSLRDDRGVPHVTMEYNGQTGHFVQIYGKQNEPPVGRYVPYVLEAIDKRFDGDPIGKLFLGMDATDLDFSGKNYKGIDFGEALPKVGGIDFSQSTFEECEFDHNEMERCIFDGCTFRVCDWNAGVWNRSSFQRATFDRCGFKFVGMDYCNFRDARFDATDFVQVSLQHATFDGASFGPAYFERADVTGASFVGSDITEGHMDDPYNFEGQAIATGTPLWQWVQDEQDTLTDEQLRR